MLVTIYPVLRVTSCDWSDHDTGDFEFTRNWSHHLTEVHDFDCFGTCEADFTHNLGGFMECRWRLPDRFRERSPTKKGLGNPYVIKDLSRLAY